MFYFVHGLEDKIHYPQLHCGAIEQLSLGQLMTSAIDFILSLVSKVKDGIEAAIKQSCIAQLVTSAIESIESVQKPVPSPWLGKAIDDLVKTAFPSPLFEPSIKAVTNLSLERFSTCPIKLGERSFGRFLRHHMFKGSI